MAIKKVVIAAAGQGTRMRPLTNNRPKHLIKVLGRPFLAYLLDNVLMAGYKELIVVTGYKGELLEKFLKDYESESRDKYKFKMMAVNQYRALGEEKYGTACPLMCTEDIVGKEEFLYVNGDNLYSVKDFQAMNVRDNYNYVAGLHHKNPQKYGVLLTDDGFLKEIVEKPKEYIGNLINTGLYKFTPEVFDNLSKVKKSVRGEYEITDVITLLAKERKVKVKEIKDYWLDFGNPADIMKLSRFLKSAKFKSQNEN